MKSVCAIEAELGKKEAYAATPNFSLPTQRVSSRNRNKTFTELKREPTAEALRH